VRTADTHDIAFLHGRKDAVGEQSARHMANMKLQTVVVFGRIGQREGTSAAAGQENVDVLTGQELQARVRRQFEVDDHDVGSCSRQLLYSGGQCLGDHFAGRADLTALDDEIGVRLGATEQSFARVAIGNG
jgi:hypothetical protein